ncbi:MAG TPA: tetratricopeptide repeat protein [Nitrospirota bacterium]
MRKTIFVIAALVVALGAAGCNKPEQKQKPVEYSGAPIPAMPSPMQIDQLQQAAKAAPKNPQAWISLGDVLMDSRRYGEAIEAYQKGLELDPKNVNARVDMGTCYRGIGKFDKAVEEYRKALAMDPNHPNGHRNLGVVLAYDLHDKAQGLKEFKKYLELSPNAPDAEPVRQSIRELSGEK